MVIPSWLIWACCLTFCIFLICAGILKEKLIHEKVCFVKGILMLFVRNDFGVKNNFIWEILVTKQKISEWKCICKKNIYCCLALFYVQHMLIIQVKGQIKRKPPTVNDQWLHHDTILSACGHSCVNVLTLIGK